MHLDRSGYSKDDDDKRDESKNKLFHLWNLYYIANVVIKLHIAIVNLKY